MTSVDKQYLLAAIARAAWSCEAWRFRQRTLRRLRGTESASALRLKRNGPPRQARLGADGPALFEGYPRYRRNDEHSPSICRRQCQQAEGLLGLRELVH